MSRRYLSKEDKPWEAGTFPGSNHQASVCYPVVSASTSVSRLVASFCAKLYGRCKSCQPLGGLDVSLIRDFSDLSVFAAREPCFSTLEAGNYGRQGPTHARKRGLQQSRTTSDISHTICTGSKQRRTWSRATDFPCRLTMGYSVRGHDSATGTSRRAGTPKTCSERLLPSYPP